MRSPLPDYLRVPHPGTTENYVVLPKSLVETMPLPWQNALHQILAEFHQAFAHLEWPEYRVVPSRKEKLVNLDEEQLAEVGYLVEIDVDGELVYRERTGRRIENPEETEVLVSVMDPIPGAYRNANQETPPRGFPVPPAAPVPPPPMAPWPGPAQPA
ncbi:hypothetical protein [Actinophytocola sp.]|uniref:hypothetical protein n=1 Tax=Actinophytocola sp. TaxID=1872138 RepID=UPI00389A37A7